MHHYLAVIYKFIHANIRLVYSSGVWVSTSESRERRIMPAMYWGTSLTRVATLPRCVIVISHLGAECLIRLLFIRNGNTRRALQ